MSTLLVAWGVWCRGSDARDGSFPKEGDSQCTPQNIIILTIGTLQKVPLILGNHRIKGRSLMVFELADVFESVSPLSRRQGFEI